MIQKTFLTVRFSNVNFINKSKNILISKFHTTAFLSSRFPKKINNNDNTFKNNSINNTSDNNSTEKLDKILEDTISLRSNEHLLNLSDTDYNLSNLNSNIPHINSNLSNLNFDSPNTKSSILNINFNSETNFNLLSYKSYVLFDKSSLNDIFSNLSNSFNSFIDLDLINYFNLNNNYDIKIFMLSGIVQMLYNGNLDLNKLKLLQFTEFKNHFCNYSKLFPFTINTNIQVNMMTNTLYRPNPLYTPFLTNEIRRIMIRVHNKGVGPINSLINCTGYQLADRWINAYAERFNLIFKDVVAEDSQELFDYMVCHYFINFTDYENNNINGNHVSVYNYITREIEQKPKFTPEYLKSLDSADLFLWVRKRYVELIHLDFYQNTHRSSQAGGIL